MLLIIKKFPPTPYQEDNYFERVFTGLQNNGQYSYLRHVPRRFFMTISLLIEVRRVILKLMC